MTNLAGSWMLPFSWAMYQVRMIIFNGDQYGFIWIQVILFTTNQRPDGPWECLNVGPGVNHCDTYGPVIDTELLSPQRSECLLFTSPIFAHVCYMKQQLYVCCLHTFKFISCWLNRLNLEWNPTKRYQTIHFYWLGEVTLPTFGWIMVPTISQFTWCQGPSRWRRAALHRRCGSETCPLRWSDVRRWARNWGPLWRRGRCGGQIQSQKSGFKIIKAAKKGLGVEDTTQC
jgi:hypothetical protein